MTDKTQQEIVFHPFSERLWEQKTAELAKVKKQLAIAVEALTEIEKSSKDVKAQSPVTQCVNNWLISHRTLIEIKELDK